MTHRLATNCAKNYCNRTPIVKVIVENVVTCFFWDTVYNIEGRLARPERRWGCRRGTPSIFYNIITVMLQCLLGIVSSSEMT